MKSRDEEVDLEYKPPELVSMMVLAILKENYHGEVLEATGRKDSEAECRRLYLAG